jgi:hypothetical protein
MAKKHPIYKIGNLVFCGNTHSNLLAPKCYGIIIDIIDDITGESYYEKEMITGHGDLNTKVKIHVKLLCKAGDDVWSSCEKLEFLKEPIFGKYNPHDVFKISKKAAEKRYIEDLEKMNIKLEFIRRYYNTRDDKINKIIE